MHRLDPVATAAQNGPKLPAIPSVRLPLRVLTYWCVGVELANQLIYYKWVVKYFVACIVRKPSGKRNLAMTIAL